MRTAPPQSLTRGLTRRHIAGMVMGYVMVAGLMLWVAVERATLEEPITTGIAPVAQSGKPLPME